MNRTHCISISLSLLVALTFAGCKSKQEAPKPAATPQGPGEVKSISGQAASGQTTASPKDKADAEAVATNVLAMMEAGDFGKIYREADEGFKKIGPEGKFVAAFENTRKKTGPLNNPRLLNFVALPDKTFVLVYRVENPHWKTDRRITLVRSKEGKMVLFGLHQHDEPVKK